MQSYQIIHTMNSLFEVLVQSQNYWDKSEKVSVHTFSGNEGIYFNVMVSSEFSGYEEDGITYHSEWRGSCVKHFHVIMLYPHYVFTCVTDNDDMPQTGWENTSNHNSGWREGCNRLTRLAFECFDEAYKNAPKRHIPKTRASGVSLRLGGIFGRVFKFVKVDKHYSPDQDYFMEIDAVKEIKKTITC